MFRHRLFKKFFAVLFATVVVALVSVREVHYIFTEHAAQHEDCHNHLHAADAHFHCEVCKADISYFSDDIQADVLSIQEVYSVAVSSRYQQPSYTSLQYVALLRGPPAVA
jgi:hypothetical protein